MFPQHRKSTITATTLDRTHAGSPIACPLQHSHVQCGAAEYVRFLAGNGTLAGVVRTASRPEHARILRGAYEIVWPVAFEGLTRGIERGRGHHNCARGVEHLEPDCLDRFEDDVEAVVDDMLRNSNVAINNLEGWIRSRLVRSTIDGNRKRRSERGALQRPRLPQWLGRLLGDDQWLQTLALDILTWVGVPATAGTGVWPYTAWVDRRAAVTRDLASTEKDVERDVEYVLEIMRRNASWYEQYVERPLGRKAAPLASFGQDADRESHLALIGRHEIDDNLLLNLAAVAMDAIAARFARGEDRRSVVVEMISTVFGSAGHRIDEAPGASSLDDDRIAVFTADHEAVHRLVNQICATLGIPDA